MINATIVALSLKKGNFVSEFRFVIIIGIICIPVMIVVLLVVLFLGIIPRIRIKKGENRQAPQVC